MAKCAYKGCKNKPIGSVSVDIDLPKFLYCRKHKDNVSNAVLWNILGAYELADLELGIKKKKNGKKAN